MKKMFNSKILPIAVLILALMTCFVACSSQDDTQTAEPSAEVTAKVTAEVVPEETAEPVVKTEISVAALSGPTGMGMSFLMESDENELCLNDYSFTISADPSEVGAALIKGDIDIAAVPINLASTLAYKTENITLIAVNTLGVLYILEDGDTINSIEDLAGRTLEATGQASTPEYMLNYILAQNGLTDDVDVQYLTEHSELTALVSTGNSPLAMMPEPNVSVAMAANPDMRVALDLTEEWSKVSDAELVQGCIVVRSDFLAENEEAVQIFLDEYAVSVDNVNSDTQTAGELISKFGIVASAEIATAAIPNCNIVCITGAEMADMAEAMLEVLFEAEPSSIGGELPDEDFYYVK